MNDTLLPAAHGNNRATRLGASLPATAGLFL
jgi:hypothetical protein